LTKIPVPGDYGWDYASTDTDGRRLYVGHDKEVVVIDLDSRRIVGSVERAGEARWFLGAFTCSSSDGESCSG